MEKEMETHSSTLAWKIPWTEEPGSPWGCRVRHDWATSLLLSWHWWNACLHLWKLSTSGFMCRGLTVIRFCCLHSKSPSRKKSSQVLVDYTEVWDQSPGLFQGTTFGGRGGALFISPLRPCQALYDHKVRKTGPLVISENWVPWRVRDSVHWRVHDSLTFL